MKKNPGFYALFTAVLMVLSAASFAAGAETDEYSFSGGCLSDGYFHLECDDDELVCLLSQIKTTSPGSNDYGCWTDGSSGVYEVLANGSYGTYTLKLNSNLYFGGRDGDNCKMAFEPLYRQVRNIDGNSKIIDGFCHITTGNAGFLDSFTGELKNITFTNAYVKGSTNAGVVASNINTRQLSNIKIDGATVIAQNAGGFAGSASQFYLQNSSIRNVNVSGKIAGGAFGRVTFTSGSYGWDADTDTLSGTNLIEGSSVAGGFIGSARISVGYMQFYLQNLVVDADVLVKSTDASLNDSLIVGGLIGSVYASSSNYNYVNLTRNTVKGSVKAKANDVNGNVYVGGLVGYAERTGTGDTYINVRGAHDYKTFDANVEADLGNVVGNVAVGGLLGNASCEYSGYDVNMEANEVVFAGNVKVVSENVTGNVAAGGFVGNINGTIDVDKSFIDGNVSYETDLFAASSNLYLGSFWGNANGSSIELEHSYSIGVISYSGVTSTQASVGYFGGYSDETVSNRRIRNNYHFGQDDFMVGIGNYSENDWKTGATYSGNCSNCLYIEYNARNAIDASEIDHTDGLRNQIYSEDEMKSDAFAAVIGGSGQEYNRQGSLFTRSDKVLGGLPSFATKEHLSIRRITLDVTSFKNSDVWNGSGYTLLTDGSKTVVDLYADDQGHLKQTDVDFMNGLLGENEFWKGPVAISTSSVFISDVQYELAQTETWNVVYHFCIGNYNNGDPVYEIGDPLMPNTYTIRYIFSPVTSFSDGDYSALVPPIFASDGSDLKTLQAGYAYLNNKTDGDPSLEIDLGFDTAFVSNDRFFDIIANALNQGVITDYHDTLHIVYQFGNYSTSDLFEISFASANNATAATYNAYAYENDGSWGNLVESVDITGNSARVPFTSGFTIDISNAPAGYSKDEYTLWFFDQYTSGEDTLISENNYLINSLDYGLYNNVTFAREYRVWKKASVSTKDTIRLDSIYKGVKRGNGSLDNLQMIVQLIPIDYTVSFDLTPFDSRTVVLGGDWTATKTGMNVETNKNLPRVYVMAQSGTKMLYSRALWGSALAATTPNARTSEYLSSSLLEEINPTSSKIKLYPVENRVANEATELKVVAFDAGGNALTNDTDYHGSVVLSQVVGDGIDDLQQASSLCPISGNATTAYTHCLYLPNAADTLAFKVSLEPEDGYAMELTEFNFDWMEPTGTVGVAPAGYGYEASTGKLLISLPYMANTDMTFKVKYTVTGPFYVTYNMNINTGDEDKLFFPTDASSVGKFEFSETLVSTDLWVPYRSDKCFDGWSVVTQYNPAAPASEPPKIMTLYADYAASALSLDPDAPTELQANWKDCGGSQPAAGVTIANGGTNAKVMLKQVFDGTEYEHLLGNDAFALPANSSGYKFFIDSAKSVVDLGYEAVGVSATYSVNGVEHELTVEGDSIVVGKTNVSEFSVTVKTQVALNNHRFWLAGNADTVFYGSSITMLEVHAQKDEPITTDVYRIGYKLKGWSFEDGSTPQQQGPVAFVYTPMTHLKFDKYFEDDYVAYAKAYGHLPDTLYAVWEAGGNADVKRVVNKSEQISSFKLMQDLGGQMFDYLVSDTLLLPAEGQFEFIVEMLYDSNQIEVDNMHAIVVLDEDGELVDILENNIRYTVEKSIGLRANMLKDKRVQFVLNENSEDQVYFGSDWIDTLASENPDSALVLPTIAYNSAKCLAGWTIDSTSNKLLKVLDKDLLNDLRAKGNALGRSISELLYARWTTNPDSCIGDFVQLAVQQENGSVWFVEGDKNTKERRFTDEGTMFVPSELDGSQFRVQASGTDTSVYVLDSLVVLRKNKVVGVLKEGDAMPANLKDVSLKAYFGWKNKTEIDFKRNPRLDVNGVRFRLDFKASDFEVRRNVSARVEVLDRAGLRVKLDTLLGDSIEMGYEKKDFMFPMKKPGNYTMVLSLKDKSGSVVTDSIDFSVSSEISVLAADTWQMISLSSVDVSAVKNDDDRIFYWWDEEGTGEYWQYKRLDLNAPVDPTLGVWYNSLEGRALPLLTDVDDEDDEEDFTWKLENVSTGWNMVANPYNWRLDLYAKNPNAKKSFDEESDISFYRYDAESADPVPVDTIGPYEAVWAYVSKNTKWKMSADPYFPPDAAPLEKRALAKASTKDRWTLQAKLTDVKGKKDSWNILGAGLNPLVADEPPASMGDHVNLAIVEGKRALAKSIKPSSDEMEWTIALSASSDRIGFLSLDGIDGVKAFGYRVFVTVDGNTTEMREGEPLKVYLKSSAKMATVRVAPAAKAVAKNTLKGLRTARLGNRLQVTFDASGLAGTNARVDIVDLKGNVKSTATAKTIEGSNALVLDAPQSGLYMLRVRAGSQQQAAKILVR